MRVSLKLGEGNTKIQETQLGRSFRGKMKLLSLEPVSRN